MKLETANKAQEILISIAEAQSAFRHWNSLTCSDKFNVNIYGTPKDIIEKTRSMRDELLKKVDESFESAMNERIKSLEQQLSELKDE
jgi:uncharacterized protein YpiB (UPF0302 family)